MSQNYMSMASEEVSKILDNLTDTSKLVDDLIDNGLIPNDDANLINLLKNQDNITINRDKKGSTKIKCKLSSKHAIEITVKK